MQLSDLVAGIEQFAEWRHADKIKLFAWHLHAHKKLSAFQPEHLSECFAILSLAPPSAVRPFLVAMSQKSPPEVIKGKQGYFLELRVRQHFEAKYGQRNSTIQVDALLSGLPDKIPSLKEKAYLEEALICFRHKAIRAAIVMTWNVAFDHLLTFLLDKHLTAFNGQLPKSFPKADILAITKRDDFLSLKESQVLQVAKTANIISPNLHKIFKEKLDRRNMAAHPSDIDLGQLTAEEFIKDLVENAILKLS
jgi:hypothetical protein